MRILVTGGARSGKSRHAARLLSGGPDAAVGGTSGSGAADLPPVTFVAPGRPADELDDADWAARVAHHRVHRPAAWRTLETGDVTAALRETPGPVLVDCLGTWLTGTIDRLGLWEAPADEARAAVEGEVARLCAALAERDARGDRGDRDDRDDHIDTVLVTNEVGSGVVPAHRSGSVFRDLLGALNQTVAAQCHEVHLVVCGRVLVM